MGSIPEVDAAADARDSAGELLAKLRRLVADDRIELRVEPKQLTHIDSPVAVDADGNIWAYAFLIIALLTGWRWGMLPGAAALVIGVAVYLTLGRAYVYRRIERRVRRDALGDLDKWRKLWRFAGVTLVAPGLVPCASPGGNWMGFVRAVSASGSADRRS